jgi:ketosteroid isomerase-like protein
LTGPCQSGRSLAGAALPPRLMREGAYNPCVADDDVAGVVRQAFLALNREDEEGFLATLHERVEWISAATGIVPRSHWHGRDAVQEGRRQVRADGSHSHTTLQEIRVDGERALVFGVITSEGPRGRLTLPMAWIWKVRDGQVVFVESFTNRLAAQRAWAQR